MMTKTNINKTDSVFGRTNDKTVARKQLIRCAQMRYWHLECQLLEFVLSNGFGYSEQQNIDLSRYASHY